MHPRRVLVVVLAALPIVMATAPLRTAADWRIVDVALLGGDPTAQGLASIADVAFTPDGELIVLDRASAEMVTFDVSSGAVVRRVGRKGQGPGEFDTPTLVAAAPDGDLYVFDRGSSNRISRFAPDGRFLDSVSTPFPSMSGVIRDLAVGQAGTYLLRVPSRVLITGLDPLAHTQLLLLEPGAEAPHSVREWSDLTVEPMNVSDSAGTLTMYTEPQPIWALLDGGRQAVGRSDRYDIAVYGRDGAHLGTLRRAIEPQPVTDEIKERFRAQLPVSLRDRNIEWGESLPLIHRVFPGPEGTIIVMRGNNGAPTIDLFSPACKFLAELSLPRGFLMMAAHDGLLAGVVETTDLEAAVRVLRLER